MRTNQGQLYGYLSNTVPGLCVIDRGGYYSILYFLQLTAEQVDFDIQVAITR